MPEHYKIIDQKARHFYQTLEKQGVPVNEELLNSLLKEKAKLYLDAQTELEVKFHFKPNPNDQEHIARIATAKGISLPKTSTGKLQSDQITIERTGDSDLKKLSELRQIRRKISVLTGIKEAVKEGRVYPSYKFDPELGRVHQGGDVKCDNWDDEIQDLVRLPGHIILVADYERMELKVLAYLSGDSQLKEDLKGDPYIVLAKKVYHLEHLKAIDKELRNKAKVAFLALIYGNTIGGVAAQLKVDYKEAKMLISALKMRYPTAFQYLEDWANEALNFGQVISYHERIKNIDTTKGEDYVRRLGYNSRQQNTAGDLAKIGFTNLYEDSRLKEKRVQFITTVHDSCIMAIPEDSDLDLLKEIIKEDMVDKNDTNFDLKVDFKLGISWAKAN